MIRLVVANQRGGVGKTTTAVNLSWYLSERGYRTLLIDTDSQGSITLMLGLRPLHYFAQFLLGKCLFDESVVHVRQSFDVMCGSKHALEAESALAQIADCESALTARLEPFESRYEAVILDASPSLSLVQTCALLYARNVLIPVNMDFLSLSGANAAYETIQFLNSLFNAQIRSLGLLPCQVNQRLSITRMIDQGLHTMSQTLGVPLLPGIRTDQTVHRAFRARKAVLEYDPEARSAQDYVSAFDKVLAVLKELGNGKIETTL